MEKVIDLTFSDLAPYVLSKVIERGEYTNILYYEFHSHLDIENEVYDSDRLRVFHNSSEKYYDNFICNGQPDDFEAVIDIAIKLSKQWFIFRECGANFYLGFGPLGILELRRSCTNKRIPIIVFEKSIDDWLSNQAVDESINKKDEFKVVIRIMRNMVADFERRAQEYHSINEDTIRDRLLAPINAAVNGRANAEAKNGKGKSDILIRNESVSNEFIIELKNMERY